MFIKKQYTVKRGFRSRFVCCFLIAVWVQINWMNLSPFLCGLRHRHQYTERVQCIIIMIMWYSTESDYLHVILLHFDNEPSTIFACVFVFVFSFMEEHEKWSQSEIICPWILLITEFNEQFTKHAIDERSYWAYTHWLLVWLMAHGSLL